MHYRHTRTYPNLDAPGECGRCSVIDWMPTFADLTWTEPGTDGGAPIMSYIIQLKGELFVHRGPVILFLPYMASCEPDIWKLLKG